MVRRDSKSFWEKIHSHCLEDLLYHSRIHPLASFSSPGCRVYVKREDESGFGISGYKKRKLASLFWHILDQKYPEVALIGGAFSNHIVACLQLAHSLGIPAQLFLKETPHEAKAGNFFLLSLLTDLSQVHWIPTGNWDQHLTYVEASLSGQPAFIVPEGGFCVESVAGMATLWEDIQTHHREIPEGFDHLFVDAGTGFSAGVLQALIPDSPHSPLLHIVSMADDRALYEQKQSQIATWIEQEYAFFNGNTRPLQFYRPFTARSFGSVNQQVLAYCKYLARTEGILTDPIYSGKLFMNAQKIIVEQKLTGNILILHSGGGTGLMGFSERFSR